MVTAQHLTRQSTQTQLRCAGYLIRWILYKKFGANEFIKLSEISRLQEFGKTAVIKDEREADDRSEKFKAFVTSIT